MVRRAASLGGTLRCAEARRVAYRDVDKSYASHRRPEHGAVARRLQDSAAAIRRAPSVYDAPLVIVPKKAATPLTRCNTSKSQISCYGMSMSAISSTTDIPQS